MITCTPAKISWTYTAGTITNDIMRLLMVKDSSIDMITDRVIDLSTGSFTWASVNVTAGNYTLEAEFPADTALSSSLPVSVVNGPNISCLASRSQSSTTRGTSSMNPPATSSATSSPPLNTSNKHTSKTSPGVIAGAVVGALVLIATALIAYLCRSSNRPGPAVTVMALDRPVAPGVVESQGAMMSNIEGLRRDMQSARGPPAQSRVDVQTARGQVDMEQQLHEMAERMAQMEAQMQTYEAPPGYTLGSPL
ncbi:hypothetical protein DFH09DRAFT_1472561 [Mycena vulgaris]|nr:hypothetical protein DFH09DRAFT_1472561 [Mycena vulgaris]